MNIELNNKVNRIMYDFYFRDSEGSDYIICMNSIVWGLDIISDYTDSKMLCYGYYTINYPIHYTLDVDDRYKDEFYKYLTLQKLKNKDYFSIFNIR